MSDARREILGKIRDSLGRQNVAMEENGLLEQRIKASKNYIRPKFNGGLVERFADQLQAVAGSFERVKDKSAVCAAIVRHLDSLDVAHKVIAAPSLQRDAWSGVSWSEQLDVGFGGTQGDDLVSVTGCFAAVAETGSVVLLSDADSPTGLNFLPDYHIALVESSQLVRHIEDVWPLVRQYSHGIPRTINFISGPSKTADVEQTLQIGAHGPRSFHVIFIDS
jgi:L-lactate dehydrogenase complex protein LldG